MKEDHWEYYSGSKELMSEELTQVTSPVLHCADIQFAIDQLKKRGIRSVIKRKKAKVWEKETWKYALLRKWIDFPPPSKKVK